jgi:hypothetical protein
MAEKKGLFSKAGKLSAPEMRPQPRSRLAGLIADAMIGVRDFADRARVPESVPLLGGQGVGSLFLGRAPEEVNELSYGNSPFQINPYAGRTGSYVPEMKRGRGAQVFDALSLLPVPGARTVAGGLFGGGLTPGVDAAATVFHGSPHKFDRFDSSKIGTGEGAQAYGHGLYLADKESVADSYRYVHGGGMPTIDSVSVDGRVISGLSTPSSRHGLGLTPARAMAEIPNLTREQAQALSILESVKGDATKALSLAANKGNNRLYAAVEELAPKFKVLEMAGPDTSLYKVDLPDEAIAKMLDWDKPLSQQPESVRAALTPEALGLQYQQLPNGNHAFVNEQGTRVGNMQKGGTPDSFRANWLDSVANSGLSGREVYQSINDGMFGKNKAAAALRQAGIPGIRYLDGGSRSAGAGSSNYVVFPGNESLLTILERNGQIMNPIYRDPMGDTLADTIR